MHSRLIGAIAGALALSLIACAETVSPPSFDDAGRSALVERTLGLKARVVAAGKLTPATLREVDALRRDILAWQTQTGRTDLSVTSSRPAVDLAVAVAPGGGVGDPCSCPSMTFSNGQICFLSEAGPCRPGELIARVCAYICVTIGPVPPVRRS